MMCFILSERPIRFGLALAAVFYPLAGLVGYLGRSGRAQEAVTWASSAREAWSDEAVLHEIHAVALEQAVADAHHAARQDFTFAKASGELLFVVVALLVAVEDSRDGRVAPVDDAQAALDARGTTEEEIAIAGCLAQTQVRKVG